jgi:quercetin dioxygenase-like cupin family protein
MMIHKWFTANAGEIKKFSAEQLINLNLFDGEAFFGRLLCFSRGQVVPYHKHEHIDECFDVLEGEGTILIDGREMRGAPGTILYVPANVEHGFRADGADRWVIRETVHERIYAGRAAKMVVRAVLKRLPVIGKRFRGGQ